MHLVLDILAILGKEQLPRLAAEENSYLFDTRTLENGYAPPLPTARAQGFPGDHWSI